MLKLWKIKNQDKEWTQISFKTLIHISIYFTWALNDFEYKYLFFWTQNHKSTRKLHDIN